MQVTESDVKWHPVITSDSVYIADKLLLVPWSQILVQIRDIFDRPYVTYYLYRTHLIAMSVILFSAEYEYMLYIIDTEVIARSSYIVQWSHNCG